MRFDVKNDCPFWIKILEIRSTNQIKSLLAKVGNNNFGKKIYYTPRILLPISNMPHAPDFHLYFYS